ncbi:MAG: flippase-like domain-containing protein [Deltaproteobacteria bacterium]|nr:flippase-like domain-containing protein [Deltaproteobacteria bacterium]
MPKKKLKTILSLTLLVALALLATFYVQAHWDEFRLLWARPLRASQWLAIFLAWLLTLTLNSEILRLGVRIYQIPLSFWAGLALNMATMAANYFLPFKGGAGLRAYYLVSRLKMSLTDFISQLLAIGVHTLSTGSFLALLGLLAMAPSGARRPLMIYFGLTFGLGLACILGLGELRLKKHPRLAAVAQGWRAFRANPKILFKLTVLQLAYFTSLAQANRLCFEAFQIEISWAQAYFYSAGQLHSTLLNLTPAGLGVVEAFGALAGQILGFTPAEALMAQGLSRLTQLSILTVIGLASWPYLNRRRVEPNAL